VEVESERGARAGGKPSCGGRRCRASSRRKNDSAGAPPAGRNLAAQQKRGAQVVAQEREGDGSSEKGERVMMASGGE